jgi:hypothetical protein
VDGWTDTSVRYESIQLPEKSSGVQPPLAWDEENLSVWLNSIARSVLGKGVKVDSDLFAQGFDRLAFIVLHVKSIVFI